MRMGAYSRSAGGPVQRATPSSGVRFSAPPGVRLGWRHAQTPAAAAVARLRAQLAVARLAEAERAKGRKLTVMTRNVYLGGNIAGPIPAPTRERVRAEGRRALWQAVADDRLPGPARSCSRARSKQHQAGRDRDAGGRAVAARARGKDGDATQATDGGLRLPEVAAARSSGGRAALPGRLGADRGGPRGADQPIGYDVRLTMRDVVTRAHAQG